MNVLKAEFDENRIQSTKLRDNKLEVESHYDGEIYHVNVSPLVVELTERNEFIVCAPGVNFVDSYFGSLENEGYTVNGSNAVSTSGKVRINVTANDYPFFFFDATKIVIKPVV